MHKTITPVVSVILLIMLTIVASVGAYFFITSEVGELQNSGAIEESPYLDNSRLNLVSITGSQALVRNDGTSPVTEIVVLINGEVLNYTLDTPIQPGEFREITYTNQIIGEDLEVKLIYNKGKIEKEVSPAIKNTEVSGFVESLCGDNLCSTSRGENVINCFSDCGIKVFMYQHEDYNSVDDAIVALYLMNNEENKGFGNRSILYVPGLELSDHTPIFLNNKYIFNGFNYNHNFSYFYYNNSEFSSVEILPNTGYVHKPKIIGHGNNVHIFFINCSSSNDNCDLLYLNWSINGFSEFESATNLKLNENNFSSTDNSPLFSVSNNEEYRLGVWISSGIVNYTLFNKTWEKNTVFEDSSVSDLFCAKVNNLGQALIIYKNGSLNEGIFYNSGSWAKINSSIFSVSTSLNCETLDESFLIFFNSGSYFNSTIFNGSEYSYTQPIFNESIVGAMLGRINFNYPYALIIKSNPLGYSFYSLYDYENNIWTNSVPVAISGVGISYCQEYERYSGECTTEIWCSDGVDNDEDGYYDLDDSDC